MLNDIILLGSLTNFLKCFLKIQSQLDVDLRPLLKKIKTEQNDLMHIYHQSTCTLLENNFSSMLAHGRRRLQTITRGRTSSHTVGHGRTSSQIFCSKTAMHGRTQSYTVVHMTAHGRTRSHKIYSYHTRSHRRPYTVAQTTARGRKWSHTVAQTTIHSHTWSHKKSSAARMAYPHDLRRKF